MDFRIVYSPAVYGKALRESLGKNFVSLSSFPLMSKTGTGHVRCPTILIVVVVVVVIIAAVVIGLS